MLLLGSYTGLSSINCAMMLYYTMVGIFMLNEHVLFTDLMYICTNVDYKTKPCKEFSFCFYLGLNGFKYINQNNTN